MVYLICISMLFLFLILTKKGSIAWEMFCGVWLKAHSMAYIKEDVKSGTVQERIYRVYGRQ